MVGEHLTRALNDSRPYGTSANSVSWYDIPSSGYALDLRCPTHVHQWQEDLDGTHVQSIQWRFAGNDTHEYLVIHTKKETSNYEKVIHVNTWCVDNKSDNARQCFSGDMW